MVHPTNNNVYEQWSIPSPGLIDLSCYYIDNKVWEKLVKINDIVNGTSNDDLQRCVDKIKRCDGREAETWIHKEEAVCRFCFRTLIQDDDGGDQDHDHVLKTICKCKFTLIHDTCASKWSYETKGDVRCNSCDQDIEFVSVHVLKMGSSPSPSSQRISNSTHPTANGVPTDPWPAGIKGEPLIRTRSSSSSSSSYSSSLQRFWSCCFCSS